MSRGPLSCAGLAIYTTLLLTAPVHADEASDAKISASLVKAFMALCVQSMSDLDPVERSATSLGWRKLQGAEGRAFVAPSPDAKTTTWEVLRYADVPFWLSITRGMDQGKAVSACTIINSDVPTSPVRAAFIDMLQLKHSFHEESHGDQDYVYWQTRVAGLVTIVSFVAATSPSAMGVNMSATLIPKRPFQ